MSHDLDAVHAQAMRILENVGTEVHSDLMLKMLDCSRATGRWDACSVGRRISSWSS